MSNFLSNRLVINETIKIKKTFYGKTSSFIKNGDKFTNFIEIICIPDEFQYEFLNLKDQLRVQSLF